MNQYSQIIGCFTVVRPKLKDPISDYICGVFVVADLVLFKNYISFMVMLSKGKIQLI